MTMDHPPASVLATEQVGDPEHDVPRLVMTDHGDPSAFDAQRVAQLPTAARRERLVGRRARPEPRRRPLEPAGDLGPSPSAAPVATEDRDVVRVRPEGLEGLGIAGQEGRARRCDLLDDLEQGVVDHGPLPSWWSGRTSWAPCARQSGKSSARRTPSRPVRVIRTRRPEPMPPRPYAERRPTSSRPRRPEAVQRWRGRDGVPPGWG